MHLANRLGSVEWARYCISIRCAVSTMVSGGRCETASDHPIRLPIEWCQRLLRVDR
jgi:hypothetical protein